MDPSKIVKKGVKSITQIPKFIYTNVKSASKKSADITFIGEKKLDYTYTQVYEYDYDFLKIHEETPNFEVFKKLEEDKVYWINFHGLHDVKIFEDLAKVFNFDGITIRHIVDTTQRPKVEEYDNYLFFTIKSMLERVEDEIDIEQLSFIMGRNYIISFQEKVGDHFEHIRKRIRERLGLVRKKKSDFLLYLLLDAILDNYFETFDLLVEDVAELEREVLKDPKQVTLLKIEAKKKAVASIKKSLAPLKEALENILNDKLTFIARENMKYYRDLRNNCSNAIEEFESLNQALEGLTNIYFSSISHKMNEIMKVLTLVSTVFIPLSFIAGIYGMNFEYIPELHIRNGYFMVLGLMGLICGLMVWFFYRKRWL